VKKQIKILDHRLEKALAKHNHTLASNKRLREGIDNMRRERIVFAQVQFARRACHCWPSSVAGSSAATWRELGSGSALLALCSARTLSRRGERERVCCCYTPLVAETGTRRGEWWAG